MISREVSDTFKGVFVGFKVLRGFQVSFKRVLDGFKVVSTRFKVLQRDSKRILEISEKYWIFARFRGISISLKKVPGGSRRLHRLSGEFQGGFKKDSKAMPCIIMGFVGASERFRVLHGL